jgi:hypothetical protein
MEALGMQAEHPTLTFTRLTILQPGLSGMTII